VEADPDAEGEKIMEDRAEQGDWIPDSLFFIKQIYNRSGKIPSPLIVTRAGVPKGAASPLPSHPEQRPIPQTYPEYEVHRYSEF
jgi:hypothetical protein